MDIIMRNETFKDKNLNEATKKIFSYGDTIKKRWFAIAKVISKVAESECYKEDGFNTVHEWTERTFGFKKSVSYSLLTIGKEYIREELNSNGKVTGYSSNLVAEGSKVDFNKTQIERMLPLGHNKATELVENGTISPDMTISEIAKVVKEVKASDKVVEAGTEVVEAGTEVVEEAGTEAEEAGTEAEEAGTEAEEAGTEVVEGFNESELVSVWTKDGTEYKLPYAIIIKYGVKAN